MNALPKIIAVHDTLVGVSAWVVLRAAFDADTAVVAADPILDSYSTNILTVPSMDRYRKYFKPFARVPRYAVTEAGDAATPTPY